MIEVEVEEEGEEDEVVMEEARPPSKRSREKKLSWEERAGKQAAAMKATLVRVWKVGSMMWMEARYKDCGCMRQGHIGTLEKTSSKECPKCREEVDYEALWRPRGEAAAKAMKGSMVELRQKGEYWYAKVQYDDCEHTREGMISDFERAVQGKNTWRPDCQECRPVEDKYAKWMGRAEALQGEMSAEVQLIWEESDGKWHAEMQYECGHWRCGQIGQFEKMSEHFCRDCAAPEPPRDEDYEARLDAYLEGLSPEDLLELYDMLMQ